MLKCIPFVVMQITEKQLMLCKLAINSQCFNIFSHVTMDCTVSWLVHQLGYD